MSENKCRVCPEPTSVGSIYCGKACEAKDLDWEENLIAKTHTMKGHECGPGCVEWQEVEKLDDDDDLTPGPAQLRPDPRLLQNHLSSGLGSFVFVIQNTGLSNLEQDAMNKDLVEIYQDLYARISVMFNMQKQQK